MSDTDDKSAVDSDLQLIGNFFKSLVTGQEIYARVPWDGGVEYSFSISGHDEQVTWETPLCTYFPLEEVTGIVDLISEMRSAYGQTRIEAVGFFGENQKDLPEIFEAWTNGRVNDPGELMSAVEGVRFVVE